MLPKLGAERAMPQGGFAVSNFSGHVKTEYPKLSVDVRRAFARREKYQFGAPHIFG
jgi:hypothetical protein